ncbi:DUF4214 domain-containing protein [Aquabacter sp. L1I39]|uniref:DUF4214 domain-containing protein n=1 Tax=Aquabacter sp. L1I39 TaxID=2820278 RepID=UPI001ADD3A9D|nr:DUF4214 domain-containing protein [Aquabacter sp. L1I39]QTL05553.1 DUF4214 domain-containing protein [Aquabacter sp. L1I39]
MAAYTLQLLHFSDAEGGLLASTTAPNLAALVDAFDDTYANTLILAGGDNWIPGPFLAAGTDPAVRDAINAVTGSTITGTIPIAAADIAIHNLIGVEASALGNHDFDLGSNVLASALSPNSGWVGAQFVSVSANLVFGPSSPYYTDPVATDSALNGIYVDTLDFNVQSNVNAPATTTEVAEASSLKGKIAPATVITEGGEKIGVVGVTTQILETISSPSSAEIAGFPGGAGANGEVDNMDLLAAQLQPIIDELIAEGVNKIVLMSHLQIIGNEMVLATKLRGVDIILSAGSHQRMGDDTDVAVNFPGHDADFAYDYPYVTSGADGKTTVIVNTDNEYTYLGRLAVDFDENGDIIADSLTANAGINGAYAATSSNVAAAWGVSEADLATTAFAEGTKGGAVSQITTAVQEVINVKDGNVYGYSTVYLEGERGYVRGQETNLGDLSADANAATLKTALAGELGTNAAQEAYVVSIKNGGGIRAQIGTLSAPDPVDGSVDKLPPEGGVSQLDVENSLRFNNKLMAFDTTAEGLKAIIEHGVASYPNQGRFPQIGGLAFSFDPDLPAGSRVLSLALIDADGDTVVRLVENGTVLSDVPDVIRVITLNYMADGGDGYPMKANGSNFRYLLDDGSLGPVLDETSDLDANPPSNAMTEQKAFELYMRSNHATTETAFDQADTEMAGDLRIQNLNARTDTVLASTAETFNGNEANDVFDGSADDDVANGGAGEDILRGHAGNDRLFGDAGNDQLIGGAGDDHLVGGSGDDLLSGGTGRNSLHGGLGNDRAVFEGNQADYEVIHDGAALIVRARADATQETRLIGVETLAFADGDMAVTDNASAALVAGLYQQVMGRLPDLQGLQYWTGLLDKGASLGDVAISMILSPEAQGRGVGAASVAEITVDLLYSTLLGRPADEAGKAYHEASLAAGVPLSVVAGHFVHAPEMEPFQLAGAALDTTFLSPDLFTRTGTASNDVVFGGVGADVLVGGAGSDLLQGGRGIDTAVFQGNRADFDITYEHGKVIVTARNDTLDVDTLVNVERVTFDDGTLDLDTDATTLNLATLYGRVLDRQADLSGLSSALAAHVDGVSEGRLLLNMLHSPEAQTKGIAMSSSGDLSVETVYRALFGDQGTEGGLATYQALEAGGANLEDVADAMMHSNEMAAIRLTAADLDFFI